MAYSSQKVPSFSSKTHIFNSPKLHIKYPKLRSQSFKGDEGKSANMVDANLCILRERIDEVKKKEKISMAMRDTSRALQHGWNCSSGYDDALRHKRANILHDSFELVGSATCLLGLVVVSGSFGIFLVSFLVHMSTMR